MIPAKVPPVRAEPPQPTELIADSGAHGPMPQQDAGDYHGHEMHPQRLVRLVGCHDRHAGKPEANGG
jgi:hypothetical protein